MKATTVIFCLLIGFFLGAFGMHSMLSDRFSKTLIENYEESKTFTNILRENSDAPQTIVVSDLLILPKSTGILISRPECKDDQNPTINLSWTPESSMRLKNVESLESISVFAVEEGSDWRVNYKTEPEGLELNAPAFTLVSFTKCEAPFSKKISLTL